MLCGERKGSVWRAQHLLRVHCFEESQSLWLPWVPMNRQPRRCVRACFHYQAPTTNSSKIHTYKGGEELPVKSPRRSDRIAARRSGAPLVREPSISTPVCRVGASARPYITREPPTMTPQNYTTKSRRLKIRTLRKKRRLKLTPTLITHNQHSSLTHHFTLHRVRRRRRHRQRHRKRYEINCK